MTARNRTVERRNAWLTLALLLGIVVLANRVARRALVVRADLSQDQLYALSDASRRTLARLEDTLSVHAFFTEDLRSGNEAMARAQLEAQLEEFRALSGGRMVVDTRDPSVSSQALSDAQQYQLASRPVSYRQGTGVGSQPVWRALLLRYRGRVETIGWANPWSLEGDFVGAVHRLLSDQRVRLGWYGDPFEVSEAEAPYGRFTALRRILGVRFDLEEVPPLDTGGEVPDGLGALIVMRPTRLHPREAFALDQYVQRGGKLVICVDQARMMFRLNNQRPEIVARHQLRGDALSDTRTGLEHVLRVWGAPVMPNHVWDAGSPATRNWVVPAGNGRYRNERFEDPSVVEATAGGFEPSFPATSGLQRATFAWAQPIGLTGLPDTLTRTDIVRSSADSYPIDLIGAPSAQGDVIRGMTQSMYATGSGAPLALACVLDGVFPSPFTKGAPRPRDPLAREEPSGPIEVTDEVVRQGDNPTQVVVFGDADWLRDRADVDWPPLVSTFGPENLALFENVLDWLTGSRDLIELRNKQPRDRPLRDFLAEEREAAGLTGLPQPRNPEEIRDRARRDAAAEARAASRRWWTMGAPVLVSLALLIGFGLAWNLSQRRSA